MAQVALDATASGDGKALLTSDQDQPCQAGKAKLRMASLFEFSNTEAIKKKVLQSKIVPKPYNVHDAYHQTGFCQFVARHPYFDNTTLTIIVINALWISIDTDGNTASTMLTAEAGYIIMDCLFFIYFSFEVTIRFLAFRTKCDCIKDGWFKFDTLLVLLYAFDPFTIALMTKIQGGDGLDLPTAVLRLFRLARLSRLVRMLRSLPELMIMIKGMVTATSSVGYTLGLLIVITYVFAIALRNLVPSAGTEDECAALSEDAGCIEVTFFSSVPEAMHNLFIFGTCGDELSTFIWTVKQQSPACLILSWLYIAFASLTVLNMLVGVLCEVISAVAAEESESMMVDKVYEELGSIMENMDENYDGTFCWAEFQAMLETPSALSILESVNVGVNSLIDMAEDAFFEDGVEVSLTFGDLLEMVLDLRGGQPSTVKDVMRLGKRFTKKVMTVNRRMDEMDGKFNQILNYMKKKHKDDKDVSISSVP